MPVREGRKMALDLYRTGKSYTIRDVALLADTTPQTVRRWLQGYENERGNMEPVFGQRRISPVLSFMELAEIVVAARFRSYGGTLQKVRDAHAYAREQWPELPYPFASLRLKMLGGEMIHQFDRTYGGEALAISLGSGQYTLPGLVGQALDLFDFDEADEMAIRWYPAGRDVPIILDPKMAGGRLSIVDRGVTVETIRRRFYKGRQSIHFIARDLDLSPAQVEEAIKFSEAA